MKRASSKSSLLSYDFTIGGILAEAWQRVKGAKATYWGALGLYFLVSMGVVIVGVSLSGVLGLFVGHESEAVKLFNSLWFLLCYFAILSLTVGFYYLGVRRAIDLPIRSKQIFNIYRRYWKVLGALAAIVFIGFFVFFVGFFLIGVGQGAYVAYYGEMSGGMRLLLLLLSGVLSFAVILLGYYLMLSFSFAPLLVYNKNWGVIQSLKASFHAFNQHWFKIIVTYLVMIVIYLLSALPLFIGVIWTFPMILNLIGILYRTMFGVERDS